MHLTDVSRPLFQQLYSIGERWKNATTDQDYINDRMHELKIPYKTLSRTTFPNGVFLNQNRYLEKDPVLVHFNHIVGMDKKRFMKNKECWLLDV